MAAGSAAPYSVWVIWSINVHGQRMTGPGASAASTSNLAAVRRQWVNMRAATAGLVDGYSCVPLPVSTLTAVSCTWVARRGWTLATFNIASATIAVTAVAVSVACCVWWRLVLPR